jgi:hypothetical protein
MPLDDNDLENQHLLSSIRPVSMVHMELTDARNRTDKAENMSHKEWNLYPKLKIEQA